MTSLSRNPVVIFLVLVFIVLSEAFTLGSSFFLKYLMLSMSMSQALNFSLTYLTTSSFFPIDCSFSTQTTNVRIPQNPSLQLKTIYVTLYSLLGKLTETHCFNYHVYVDDSISVFLTFYLLIYPTTPLTLLLNILTWLKSISSSFPFLHINLLLSSDTYLSAYYNQNLW